MFGRLARRLFFMAMLIAMFFGLFVGPKPSLIAADNGIGPVVSQLRAVADNRQAVRQLRLQADRARDAAIDRLQGQQFRQPHQQVQQLVVPTVPYVPAQQLLLIQQPAALISPPVVVQPLQVQAFYQPPALLLAPQQLNGQARLVVPGCSGL
jgi:hypothetical protein